MHRAARTAAACAGTLALVLLAAPAPAGATQQFLYSLQDSRIIEASGIGVGQTSPTIDYMQNDSGDTNRFFAVGPDGWTAATITVPGATNVDWEDLATGNSASGVRSVYLADIGDNSANRSEVDVYRVNEPTIPSTWRGQTVTTGVPDEWRLHYPTGPVNAESFAVRPGGTGYIVTKSSTGQSYVWRLPAYPSRNVVQNLIAVGPINFAALHPAGGPADQLLATGAAFSRDGTRFVVRTYMQAYVWRVTSSLGAALRTTPGVVTLPSQPQGEGIAFDGASDTNVVTDSEGRYSDVYRASLPG